jgi:hypothetical protein
LERKCEVMAPRATCLVDGRAPCWLSRSFRAGPAVVSSVRHIENFLSLFPLAPLSKCARPPRDRVNACELQRAKVAPSAITIFSATRTDRPTATPRCRLQAATPNRASFRTAAHAAPDGRPIFKTGLRIDRAKGARAHAVCPNAPCVYARQRTSRKLQHKKSELDGRKRGECPSPVRERVFVHPLV